jgi:hypothetical protein
MKRAKPHGPTSKQAHLSFDGREDAELGRGGLPVAARADLRLSVHTRAAPSDLLTKPTQVVDDNSAADSARADLPVCCIFFK